MAVMPLIHPFDRLPAPPPPAFVPVLSKSRRCRSDQLLLASSTTLLSQLLGRWFKNGSLEGICKIITNGVGAGTTEQRRSGRVKWPALQAECSFSREIREALGQGAAEGTPGHIRLSCGHFYLLLLTQSPEATAQGFPAEMCLQAGQGLVDR